MYRNVLGIMVGVIVGRAVLGMDGGPIALVIAALFFLLAVGSALSMAMAVVAMSRVASSALMLGLLAFSVGLFPPLGINSSWALWMGLIGFSWMLYSLYTPHVHKAGADKGQSDEDVPWDNCSGNRTNPFHGQNGVRDVFMDRWD